MLSLHQNTLQLDIKIHQYQDEDLRHSNILFLIVFQGVNAKYL